jgi:hypothetical protein
MAKKKKKRDFVPSENAQFFELCHGMISVLRYPGIWRTRLDDLGVWTYAMDVLPFSTDGPCSIHSDEYVMQKFYCENLPCLVHQIMFPTVVSSGVSPECNAWPTHLTLHI